MVLVFIHFYHLDIHLRRNANLLVSISVRLFTEQLSSINQNQPRHRFRHTARICLVFNILLRFQRSAQVLRTKNVQAQVSMARLHGFLSYCTIILNRIVLLCSWRIKRLNPARHFFTLETSQGLKAIEGCNSDLCTQTVFCFYVRVLHVLLFW